MAAGHEKPTIWLFEQPNARSHSEGPAKAVMAGRGSTPTPAHLVRHLSPDRRGRGSTETPPPFLSPGQGERWFAKQTGVGVLSLVASSKAI